MENHVPENRNFYNSSAIKRKVPGLRDDVEASPCKVYKIIDGKEVLTRIEPAPILFETRNIKRSVK